jgi:2-C-methyl-D-erythritol 4-phosphate cytidylyltransferase
VPGLPIADTVKRVDRDQVVETLDRASLVISQTPQAFVWPVLRDAAAGGDEATDCAAMVEARGGRIKIVPGDRRLLKITDQADLDLVESWLVPAPAE